MSESAAARARLRVPTRAGLLAPLLAIVLACLACSPAGAQESASLYQVDVPVADQSATARQQAARHALAIVLMRLTGVVRVQEDPRVRRALGNPDRYYVQFSYQTGGTPGELLLRLQFSPQALFQLIRETGLPIWPSARPVVLAWLLVDQDGELRIPDAAADDPVGRALLARALERGLVVKLASLLQPVGAAPAESPGAEAPAAGASPLASGTEAATGDAGAMAATVPAGAATSPAGIVPTARPETRSPEEVAIRPALPDGTPVWPTVGYWNAGVPELLALSRPAPADLRVIARLRGGAAGAWAGEVEIHDPAASTPGGSRTVAVAGSAPSSTAPVAADGPDGVKSGPLAQAAEDALAVPVGPVILEASAATAEGLASGLLDRVVEYLLGRYQVEAGDSSVVSVTVRGIGRARDYADVVRIFSQVEVIDDVGVVGAVGDRVRFALTTGAAPEQLLALVTADGRLAVDPASQMRTPLPPEPGTTLATPTVSVGAGPGTVSGEEPAAVSGVVAAPSSGAAAAQPGESVQAEVPGAALELLWRGS